MGYTLGMVSTAAPYEMNRTQDVCAQTGRALEVGEQHIAALLEMPGEESMLRVAYSLDAWSQGPVFPEGATLFGFWKRVVPESAEQPKPLVSEDELFDLFEQLSDAKAVKQLAFRYLLALILMRKKVLLYERSVPVRGEEPGMLVLRQRIKGGGGALFEVIDPGLDDETIAMASEELGQVMNLDENPL